MNGSSEVRRSLLRQDMKAHSKARQVQAILVQAAALLPLTFQGSSDSLRLRQLSATRQQALLKRTEKRLPKQISSAMGRQQTAFSRLTLKYPPKVPKTSPQNTTLTMLFRTSPLYLRCRRDIPYSIFLTFFTV